MLNVLDSLAPVFLLIAFGAFLVKTRFLNAEMLRGMNDLAYWIGLPALLFHRIATASFETAQTGPVLTVFFLGTAGCLAAAWVAARLLRIPSSSRGTLVQAGFRGNLAFIGLPVVIFAFSGLPAGEREVLEATAALSLGPILVVYNVLAVWVLLASQTGAGAGWLRRLLRQIVTNPLILASAAGFLYSFSGWGLVTSVERPLQVLAQLGLPLALLCIGGSLVLVPVKGSAAAAAAAAWIKVGIGPLGGFAAGWMLGVPKEAMLVAMILLASPTAAASYVLVRQLGGDEAMSAAAVVLSTLFSLISLTVVVAMV